MDLSSDLIFPVIATVISALVITAGGLVARALWRRYVRRRARKPAPAVLPAPGSADRGKAVLARIQRLRSTESPAIAIVGAVYLDIILYPVDTDRLEDHEWADIEPLAVNPGGAAYFVGHDLHEQFGRSAHLFSGFGGANDDLSRQLTRLIQREEWVLNELAPVKGDHQSAISVHLVQRDHARTAIFTHRGAVAQLGWGHVRGSLEEAVSAGGVVFISGYFKTLLQTGLGDELKRLHAQNVLVIADPGTVDVSSTDTNQMSNLREALQAGLIDVHISGFKEFLKVYGVDSGSTRPKSLQDLSARLPSISGKLAPIVLIRGNDLPDGLSAISIVDGAICATVADDTAITRSAHVGSKNGFTAGLIDALLTGEEGSSVASIKDVMAAATAAALNGWKVACE